MGHTSAGSLGTWVLAANLFVLCLQPAIAQPSLAPDRKATDERITKAIQDLGDSSFAVRQAAQNDLLDVGEPAEKPLQSAVNSNDTEVARRARFILTELTKRRAAIEVEKVTWPALLERVRVHASNDDWQKQGLQDLLIERAVEKLIDQVNRALIDERVRLPIRFDECKPLRIGGREPRMVGMYFCGQGNVEIRHAERSIFLVDGNVKIESATDCVVIARGAAHVMQSTRNVVLAGHYVEFGFDNLPREERGRALGSSLVLSGSTLHISHAHQSICYAPNNLDMSHTKDCTLLNSARKLDPQHQSTQQISDAKLPFVPAAPTNPIADQLRIIQVIPRVYQRDDDAPGFVVIEQGGVEIVLRPGKEICDNLGKPIPALAGWKLSFMTTGYAIFSNGKEDAGFEIGKKR